MILPIRLPISSSKVTNSYYWVNRCHQRNKNVFFVSRLWPMNFTSLNIQPPWMSWMWNTYRAVLYQEVRQQCWISCWRNLYWGVRVSPWHGTMNPDFLLAYWKRHKMITTLAAQEAHSHSHNWSVISLQLQYHQTPVFLLTFICGYAIFSLY